MVNYMCLWWESVGSFFGSLWSIFISRYVVDRTNKKPEAFLSAGDNCSRKSAILVKFLKPRRTTAFLRIFYKASPLKAFLRV